MREGETSPMRDITHIQIHHKHTHIQTHTYAEAHLYAHTHAHMWHE